MKTSALSVLCLAACTSVNSVDLKTAGMSAFMTVSADGTGASQVSTALHVDTSATDFVNLTPGDTLSATAGTATQPLSESSVLGAISYSTTFQGEDAASTEYTIAFTRASDVSAPSSKVTLPAPFALTAPASSLSLSRANGDLVITWSPSGTSDQMSFQATGDCIQVLDNTINGDPGTVTIAKGTILPLTATGSGANASCQITVTLSRNRAGVLDPAYGSGGSISATQVRSVTFLSTP